MKKLLAIVPIILLFATGCGGINSSTSLSPLPFLLMKAKPAVPAQPIASANQSGPATQMARVN